jgi:hypothetical protein
MHLLASAPPVQPPLFPLRPTQPVDLTILLANGTFGQLQFGWHRYLELPGDIGPAAEKRRVEAAIASINGIPCVPFADGRLAPFGDPRFSACVNIMNLPTGAVELARKIGLVEIDSECVLVTPALPALSSVSQVL